MAPENKPPVVVDEVDEPVPASSSSKDEEQKKEEAKEPEESSPEESSAEKSSSSPEEEEASKSISAPPTQTSAEKSSSGGEEVEEEEEANNSTPAPKTTTQTQEQPLRKPETESESDDDQSQSVSDDADSDSEHPELVASNHNQQAKPATKRGAQGDVEAVVSNAAKRRRKHVKSEPGEDETKAHPFQRVWSDADEIKLLKGFISFKDENGDSGSKLPKDRNLFFEFVKKNLHFSVSINQLTEKLRRIRKKYLKGKGGSSRNSHDLQIHELCHQIWGDLVEDPAHHSNGSSKKKAKARVELPSMMDLDNVIDLGLGLSPKPVFGNVNLNVLRLAEIEDFVVKRGLEFSGIEEKAQMEERWKNLQMKSLQLLVEKTQLLKKQAKIALAAYEAGKY
ncbi:hypothetical protein Tsubulata_027148 [Turnera subulata]|uniref:Glabrous enhancer-binding protein-like DBD domain-containing protein n=1 Tax=Turnera subulata TaxID=218843 RepID=A0A9Q0G674_9ROSI|nr:hypothetical protein Tsubulata_027148 [Turnera subulata]